LEKIEEMKAKLKERVNVLEREKRKEKYIKRDREWSRKRRVE
jgi:hypothetical protein